MEANYKDIQEAFSEKSDDPNNETRYKPKEVLTDKQLIEMYRRFPDFVQKLLPLPIQEACSKYPRDPKLEKVVSDEEIKAKLTEYLAYQHVSSGNPSVGEHNVTTSDGEFCNGESQLSNKRQHT